MAAVLCSALYPNIVQILTPDLKYTKTASGAMCKAHTADQIKVTLNWILARAGAIMIYPVKALSGQEFEVSPVEVAKFLPETFGYKKARFRV